MTEGGEEGGLGVAVRHHRRGGNLFDGDELACVCMSEKVGEGRRRAWEGMEGHGRSEKKGHGKGMGTAWDGLDRN